jgi:hypothetical protein
MHHQQSSEKTPRKLHNIKYLKVKIVVIWWRERYGGRSKCYDEQSECYGDEVSAMVDEASAMVMK